MCGDGDTLACLDTRSCKAHGGDAGRGRRGSHEQEVAGLSHDLRMRTVAAGENGGRRGRLWPLVLWTGVIVLVVVPWGSFQNHSHWSRVQWIPFVTPPVGLRDIVANVLFYAPFGYWSMRLSRRPRMWHGLVFAFALSAATELTQVYSHGRFPSSTDLVCNVVGAGLGTLLARRFARVSTAGASATR